jgi:hypothetical protein
MKKKRYNTPKDDKVTGILHFKDTSISIKIDNEEQTYDVSDIVTSRQTSRGGVFLSAPLDEQGRQIWNGKKVTVRLIKDPPRSWRSNLPLSGKDRYKVVILL